MCLDVYNGLSSANYFLIVSLSASFIGWITVFIIVLAFSKRIIAPVSKSYERQKRFISDAGHEIKTPLAIIEANIGVIETSNSAKNLTKENAEHLFDRFYRADESRNSETGGHGIGLSMAKAIVEAHKGKISAEITGYGKLRIKAVL